MIDILSEKKWGSNRFQHTTHHTMQFDAYELFTSGISHLILLENVFFMVTETRKSEISGKGGLLYFLPPSFL
jgi:hypothetical protein